ncbi:hypothetical protein OCU04_009116 [Sclerotinia nivalis]|uniref:Uncharacterized protein n=1 Tax=Sclerotinia nivalis TaxID=352851 RepID=A0A9X0AGX3_9HELO|nr:hypothetical protein OCU04_009116 [Sclerotinia nivalis]
MPSAQAKDYGSDLFILSWNQRTQSKITDSSIQSNKSHLPLRSTLPARRAPEIMGVQWEVTYFSIQSSGDSVLFANHVMQVTVDVLIKAIDPTTNTPYTLRMDELFSSQLIDYDDVNAELGDGWAYSNEENVFAHSMPPSHSVVPATEPHDNQSMPPQHNNVPAGQPLDDQSQRWWVTTGKIESKSVGARIQQPNGTWVSTHSDKFDTHVSLRGVERVTYTLDNVKFVKEDTDGGTDTIETSWDQDNYYLTSKVHPFNMVVLDGHRYSDYSVEGLRMCTAYYQWATWKWLHYFWYMGPKTKAKVGITSFEDGTPVQGGNVHDININEHPQAFCLTRLWIYTEANIYSTDWWYSSTIKIFDDYGNQGNFILDTGKENRSQIILKDDASVTLESSDSGTIHYGKENTISNTLPEEIPEDIRDAILAKQSRIA